MTPPWIVLTKKSGETPLEAIRAWKQSSPEYLDVPASYAGRLDPMADGLLLVLLGDECKKQEQYRGLDKEYEVELLLGVATDTGEVLGIPTEHRAASLPTSHEIRRALTKEIGSHVLPYPSYSSKTVNGKPLFTYALEGTLDSIPIPTHTETIYRISHLDTETLSKEELKKYVDTYLQVVPKSDEPSKILGADFRQDTIRDAWTTLFRNSLCERFVVLRLRVVCGSGAYMRSLAERIGNTLGTQACAIGIHRTRIGTYLSLGIAGVWTKEFNPSRKQLGEVL